MSLRGELLEYFRTTDTESSGEIATREVLKIFEKRIDSFIGQSKKRQEQRRKDPDTDKFYEGWFAAIGYFKELELLK